MTQENRAFALSRMSDASSGGLRFILSRLLFMMVPGSCAIWAGGRRRFHQGDDAGLDAELI
jgi:hypothetical protein